MNINAFDLKITYNSNILLLESWSLGDYLSNLAQVKKEQAPGSLRLVYTQLATPPVSGDGILLHLVFNSISAGNSPVAFGAVSFADSAGNLIYPEMADGVIIVQTNVSPTSTPTNTPTLTRTPTQTKTQSFQPSLTGTLSAPSVTLTSALPEATLTNAPEATGTVTEGVSPTEEQNPDNNGLLSETAFLTITPQNEENLTNGGGEIAQTASNFQESSELGKSKNETLNKFLWVTLIVFVITLVIMVSILIKRKKTERLKEW